VLSQSGAILDYLAGALGQFGPTDDGERGEILRWLLWDNHKLTSYSATYRFMNYFQNKTDDPVTQFFHARAVSAWKVLDAHLASRDFVAADRPTIADLSLCGYLFWPEQIGMDPDAYPNIQAVARAYRCPAPLQTTRKPDAERDGSCDGNCLNKTEHKHSGDTDG
jgi:glutathione S-transferase